MKDNLYDWQYLLNEYRKYSNQHKLVIEIGASNRNRTRALAKLCQKLIGIEYYQKRIPKNFNNIIYKQGDWQRLSKIKSNKYDILVSSHTIEHIKNDLAAINQTYRVLKKGGIALITTPNRHRLVRLFIEIFTGKKKFPYGEHQREYSYQDLVTLLSKTNFKEYQIIPIAFGLHGGKLRLFIKKVPTALKKCSCFWLVKLYKK